MGEIFARPIPASGLPFTGERLTSEIRGQTEIEHLHRYMLARHLCRDRDVLDIASGEGYGAALLSQAARSVVGVELSRDAVVHAATNYVRTNLCFCQGDACQIPLADASVDVVVSFETIEHLNRQVKFLSEVKRVLRSGGMLIVSTPDRDNYSPTHHPANPYHALELTRDEFAALLGRHFSHVAMCWQRAMVGSAMLPGPDAPLAHETICFERRGDGHFEASVGYPRPQYLVAVCSDALPTALPASVYIDSSYLNVREDHLKAIIAADQDRIRAAEAIAHNARLQLAVAEARAAAAEAAARAAETAARETQGVAAAARLAREGDRAEVEELRREIAALRRSTSWRLTGPLRAIGGLVSGRRN